MIVVECDVVGVVVVWCGCVFELCECIVEMVLVEYVGCGIGFIEVEFC